MDHRAASFWESPEPAPRAIRRGERIVVVDLPHRLPVQREEIALLRACLGAEIDEILFGPE